MTKRKWWLLTINAKTTDESTTTEEQADKLTELLKREYYNEVAHALDLPENFAVSHERGEEGTEHWHIILGYTNQRHFNSIKNKAPRAHIDPMKGSPKETKDYLDKVGKHEEKACTKIGETFSYGDFPDIKQKESESSGELFRRFLEEIHGRGDENPKDIMLEFILANPQAMRYMYQLQAYISALTKRPQK